MPRQAAISGSHLDWGRELCQQGCKEWVPWYQGRKGKTVYGCRIGEIPQKVDGQRVCRHCKPTKAKRRP